MHNNNYRLIIDQKIYFLPKYRENGFFDKKVCRLANIPQNKWEIDKMKLKELFNKTNPLGRGGEEEKSGK